MLVVRPSDQAASSGLPWRSVLAAMVAAGLFLLLPGDVRHKAHLLLQGVCAQRPSHSFQFSGQPLPVDARMTGIYLGAAASLLWHLLILRGEFAGRLTRGVWALLGLGIAVMMLDGFNSLAADLQLPSPYTSTNLIRVVTGLLAGVAIGTFLGHLATITLTRRPKGGWKPAPVAMLAPPLAIGAFACSLAMSGLPPLALPLTWLILVSVLAILWVMTSVLVSLALGRAWGFARPQERDETLAIALLAACALLVGLAAWRTGLEYLIGPIRLS
jgi:uncharacterized membrane protein